MLFQTIAEKVVNHKQLKSIRETNKNKKIVFCTGCYDILQSGHAVFFNQCKQFGDLLVVGVGQDHAVKELKGAGRPVNPENNRVHLVAAFQDVDYATLNDDTIAPGKIDFKDVLEKLRPDVFVLNEGDSGMVEKNQLCDKIGIRMEFVQRIVPKALEATSTTRIIDKIKFAYRAPLRIDFAGGWTDIPYIMGDKTGFVSNITISPLIELKSGRFNFSGYPRGSGLSTSTAAQVLELISAKNYNSESKTLENISEDLFNLENKELNWAIGRQDQYSIVHGGFGCWEFGRNYARRTQVEIPRETLEEFKKGLLLLHTGASRNAQTAVEDVYSNHLTPEGQEALDKLAGYALEFAVALKNKEYILCAEIMEKNFEAQKQLASATSNGYLEEMYAFAKENGAYGGKIAGAGGGGAYLFYCKDPVHLTRELKKNFVDCFEINFEFHYEDIKALNRI